jgi:predicted nucleotide-binding protein/SAM-dependent methyltransferase
MSSTTSNAQANVAANKELLKVFVATTSEALDTDWFSRALEIADEKIKDHHPHIDLRPWNIEFRPGDITVTRLLEIAPQLLGAVILLTGDDQTEERGESKPSPRDNLILEAGLFLGQLSLGNVLLLREENSKWPSDLLGVTPKKFASPPSEREGSVEITAKRVAAHISAFVARLSVTASPMSQALRRSIARAIRQAHGLEKKLISGPSEHPVDVPVPEYAYLEAVKAVSERFMTTTYLDSDFWTSRDVDTLAANRQMLTQVKEAGGVARRLILLRRPLKEELEAQRKIRRLLRAGDPEMVARMDHEFQNLAEANIKLTNQGFEVKVVYDDGSQHELLPPEIPFKEEDTEFALYDRARLDVFSGFTSSEKRRLHAYLDGHFSQFVVLFDAVDSYFEKLWNAPDACDFSTFVTKMNTMIYEVGREIDYTSNWLAEYDEAVGGDGDLKRRESEFVRHRLEKNHGKEAAVVSHIDVGTCTGRYLKELAHFIKSDGQIVGVDSDRDCINLLRSRKENNELDSRAEIVSGDLRRREELPPEKFEIVTCMMGTLCHLERRVNGKAGFEDEWQIGLENLAHLLADDGDAFIAVWDRRVCKKPPEPLLSIYSPKAAELLCEQTPSMDELRKRLKQAGLELIQQKVINGRLRVLQLNHAS